MVLTYGMKSALGPIIWATIDPPSWVDVVEDGGEVRLEITGTGNATQSTQAQWTESFLPGATVTFRYERDGSLATTLVPKTYEVWNFTSSADHDAGLKILDNKIATKLAMELFKINPRDSNDVSLEFWIPNAGSQEHCRIIHPPQWLPVILQMAKENPRFEVYVKRRLSAVLDWAAD
jgi:hypothetical protein